MTNTEDSGDNNPYFGTVKDIPAEADLLGIKKYTDGLSNFIMNCETPMTIAIQGGWGNWKIKYYEAGSRISKRRFG